MCCGQSKINEVQKVFLKGFGVGECAEKENDWKFPCACLLRFDEGEDAIDIEIYFHASVLLGNVKVKIVPISFSLSTVIVPLNSSVIIDCTIDNPNPMPFDDGLVEKNGLKICGSISSSIPRPIVFNRHYDMTALWF